MVEPGWGTRFYGMTVPRDVAAAADERLTDRAIADLVDAHLAINDVSFGAIDKTLSGFVVLGDRGDDYTLYDLRDGKQVWWQDHETREVTLRHDKLGGTKPAKRAKSSRTVATPALCARYQWLVWMLACPLAHTQTADELVRGAIGRFRATWDRAGHAAAFEAELRGLVRDPHLAIYWLLDTTMRSDDERRGRVVAALAEQGPRTADRSPVRAEQGSATPRSEGPPVEGPELVCAFVARFGALARSGDIPVVPEFRARRALALTYGAFELLPDEVPAACLAALEISPSTSPLVHGLQVVAGLERGALDAAQVQAVLARIPDVTAGTELVRAVLDKRGGLAATKRADALAQLIAAGGEAWYHALEALWLVHELAYDGVALVAATRKIVAGDRFHRRALQMAMRAAQIAGEPIEAIEADIAVADGVMEPYKRLADAPADWATVVRSLDGLVLLRAGLAWRVLQRVELNRPEPALFAWAAAEVLARGEPGGAELVGAALAKLPPSEVLHVLGRAAAIDRADHPAIALWLAALAAPWPADDPAELDAAEHAAAAALAPWAHEPAVFARLMALVEPTSRGATVALVCRRFFHPASQATYLVPRLDAAQAVRTARALIAIRLRHADDRATAAASDAIAWLTHPGAEPFVIDALTEYAVRFAATKEPGGAFESVVDALYKSVSRMGTPAARAALVDWLFAERRTYWRMADALAAVWSSDVHHQIMGLLAERRDARAAGCYAFALVNFVKQQPPLVELTRLIGDWQGDTEQARRFLHYALVVGIVAALDAGDLELVRRAHEAAAWISEPPLEPGDARGWTNPLDEPKLAARLARVLSGEPERQVAPKPEARSPGKAKPKPKAKPAPKARPKAKAAAKAKPKPKPKPKAKPKPKPKRRK